MHLLEQICIKLLFKPLKFSWLFNRRREGALRVVIMNALGFFFLTSFSRKMLNQQFGLILALLTPSMFLELSNSSVLIGAFK